MPQGKKTYNDVNEYIGSFPEEIRTQLNIIRDAIKKSAPSANEIISYQMPAYRTSKVLVWFAAFKNHIGFYPTAEAVKKFSRELSAYETSKGAIKFPLGEKMPAGLISRITRYRLNRVSADLLKKK